MGNAIALEGNLTTKLDIAAIQRDIAEIRRDMKEMETSLKRGIQEL